MRTFIGVSLLIVLILSAGISILICLGAYLIMLTTWPLVFHSMPENLLPLVYCFILPVAQIYIVRKFLSSKLPANLGLKGLYVVGSVVLLAAYFVFATNGDVIPLIRWVSGHEQTA